MPVRVQIVVKKVTTTGEVLLSVSAEDLDPEYSQGAKYSLCALPLCLLWLGSCPCPCLHCCLLSAVALDCACVVWMHPLLALRCVLPLLLVAFNCSLACCWHLLSLHSCFRSNLTSGRCDPTAEMSTVRLAKYDHAPEPSLSTASHLTSRHARDHARFVPWVLCPCPISRVSPRSHLSDGAVTARSASLVHHSLLGSAPPFLHWLLPHARRCLSPDSCAVRAAAATTRTR